MKAIHPETILGWLAVLMAVASIIGLIVFAMRTRSYVQHHQHQYVHYDDDDEYEGENESEEKVVGVRPGVSHYPHAYTGTDGYVRPLPRRYAKPTHPMAHPSHTSGWPEGGLENL